MATGTSTRPSFSRRRKWSIGLNVALALVVASAVVAMVNYLSSHYFKRFYLSTRTRIDLSPRTLSLLRSLTNQIQVTLYYDKYDDLYSTITDLLKEYAASPKISVQFVDYNRDAGLAQKIKAKYSNLGSATNVVIFACEGRPARIVPGAMLTEQKLEPVPSKEEDGLVYRHRPTAFKGEVAFTGAILAVTSPRPFKAYFLQGDGEPRIDEPGDPAGYTKFASILQQNYVQVEPLWLVGTNTVPADCDLLIIAGPVNAISRPDRIEQYLNEGGRLFALFNAYSINRETGLEKILKKWGVDVSTNIVKDEALTSSDAGGADVFVVQFTKHPAVNPLIGSTLRLFLPRMINTLDVPFTAVDSPTAEAIAFSSPYSHLAGNHTPREQWRSLPLMVAVEKGAVKGVPLTERGATRMLVVGDSVFLDNHEMDPVGRDFVGFAANWLLDRTVLLQGLGPRPVTEYQLMMTKNQVQTVQWLLLGALPGGVLLFGGLVWLRRRK